MFYYHSSLFQNVHHYINTGKSASKFGLDPVELDVILQEIKQEKRLQLVGIHCHLGSTIEASSVFRFVHSNIPNYLSH